MPFLRPEIVWKLGKGVAVMVGLGMASCSQVGKVGGGGGMGKIATAKPANERALGVKAGERIDSEEAGFVAQETPGSVEGVVWAEEAVGFWEFSEEGRFPIFATATDAVWVDDEVPVYRSISEFRRPEGYVLAEEEAGFADGWEEGEGSVSEEVVESGGAVGTAAGEALETGGERMEITADREVPEAVLTLVAPAGRTVEEPAGIYEVKEGDTLWEIARAHGTTASEIKRINGLRSDRIKPGDRLRLPVE